MILKQVFNRLINYVLVNNIINMDLTMDYILFSY
jgi:hypothetical protein